MEKWRHKDMKWLLESNEAVAQLGSGFLFPGRQHVFGKSMDRAAEQCKIQILMLPFEYVTSGKFSNYFEAVSSFVNEIKTPTL